MHRDRKSSFRLTFFLAALLGCLSAAPAVSQAAVRLVDPAGTDAGDCIGAPCQHIQYAVNQAAPNDTVSVAAGVYDTEPNNQVVIGKGITLQGAGIGQSIIDGNTANNLAAGGTVRVFYSTTDPFAIDGFTIREAGQTGTGATTPRFGLALKGQADLATAPTFTISNIRVEGNGPGGRDYNLYDDGSTADVEVFDSQFVNAAFNPILFERAVGELNFHDNYVEKTPGTTAASAFFDMNHGGNVFPGNADYMAQPHVIHDNVIVAGSNTAIAVNARPTFGGAQPVGGYERVEITDNDIVSAALGILVANDSNDPDGSDAEIRDVLISGNDLSGRSGGGVGIRGLVSSLEILQNDLRNGTRSVQFVTASGGSHASGPSDIHFNLMSNNSTAAISKVAAAGAVNAENNWYGCNEGPNNPGCSAITDDGIDYDPWLVLGVSANPTAINEGGETSQITADTRRNSSGALVGSAFRDGESVAFGTTLGSIDSPQPLASGAATSTLTSGSASGTATVSATLDGETATTSVTINDTTDPDTTITSGPGEASTTTDVSPTFEFESNEANSTFECKVDDSAFGTCQSPYTTPNLGEGSHTFSVRATDASGNTDDTPATRTFNVDAPDQDPPQTTIDSGPANGDEISDPTPTFEFSSDEAGSTFECSVDGGGFASCTSPETTVALTDGSHTFAVRATDPGGNTDGSPASRTFTVDTAPPDTTIDSGPAEGSTGSDPRPTFTFSSDDGNASFECSLDGTPFSGCSSPYTTPSLGDGEHTFVVRAIDAAGNADPDPAARSFTVDTAGPRPSPLPQSGICVNIRNGGNGDDNLTGTGFGDRMHGRRGADTIRGAKGRDCLFGNSGADTLIGGPGADRLQGNFGPDVLKAVDGDRDIVRCGYGRDRTIVDDEDVVTGCETVIRKG